MIFRAVPGIWSLGGCASNHCELNGIKKRVNFFVILILKEVVNKSWRGGGDGWIE